MSGIFLERYNKLNEAQKKAVDAVEGPVLVIAGPGSGKTELLSLRVANILHKTDVLPGNILCLTFTESAAANMRERLVGLIGQDAYRVAIFTFHSFCVDVINRYPEFFYNSASFSAADELTQIAILEELFTQLPHHNPLAAKHPEQGFVFLKDAREAIKALKKAGLTPEEFKNILVHNTAVLKELNPIIGPLFEQRLSAKEIGKIEEIVSTIRSHATAPFPYALFRPLPIILADSLELAVAAAKEADKATPLSDWKQRYTKKDDKGERVLKDTLQLGRLHALADVYEQYRATLYARGYYDFDDMVLDTIAALEKHPVLLHELQERYLYILVDEFQDTNEAQMRLIRLLADASVNEGRPNIMAVGDDDQAIFKFQGAEVANILGFQQAYVNPLVITLTHNYRSTQPILDLAQFVIKKGSQRLEQLLPGIAKKLIPTRQHMPDSGVASRAFATRLHEYNWIAAEIKRRIEAGEKQGGMAVIGRHHKDLEALVPHLQAVHIPLAYERQQNVLRQPHIQQIITMCRFIASLARKFREEADDVLPTILSYPFWSIDRIAIWKLSVTAHEQRRLWIECMLQSENIKLKAIAEFFLHLAAEAAYQPAEQVLDLLIGSHASAVADTEADDDIDVVVKTETSFTSPFRQFYFGQEKFASNKAEYLSFLSSLRTFIQAVREYKQGQLLTIDDVLEFVDTHEKNNLPLTDTSPFITARDAVQLLTAHKAKGLEFDTVFVVSCQEDVWAGRGLASKIPFPINLPIMPSGDTVDDKLRLLYVALTRARHNLYLTSHESDDDGSPSLRVNFLVPAGEKEKAPLSPMLLTALDAGASDETKVSSHHVLEQSVKLSSLLFIQDEKALLLKVVENYQLSVTHLNTFLDVTKGPRVFLEQNLLRFPQAKTAASAYGTAMHDTIRRMYADLRANGALADVERVRAWFGEELQKQRLNKNDFNFFCQRGKDNLSVFYEQRKHTFDQKHLIEFDFRQQGVVVGGVPLSGKIDKMVRVAGSEISVHDFKTGKAFSEWQGYGEREKIKLHNYKRQLVFYKLLVENSREFGGQYVVNKGVLEFLEPVDERVIDLSLAIEHEEVERLRALIVRVYEKIKNLDFPDVSLYDESLEGIAAFEGDLLTGKV